MINSLRDTGHSFRERIIGNAGIVIANTGSPAAPTSDAVADYLRLFLSDPHICPVNPHVWNLVLNRFIIPKRAPRSAAKYARIWTDRGSPLDMHMASLAQKLEEACREDGVVCVRHASSYSKPSLEDALSRCKAAGCDTVVLVPLYPQSAYSTTGAVEHQAEEALAALGWRPDLRFVDSYCDDEAYIDAVADSIAASGFDAGSHDRLLFAFHSIPVADIRKGDTYGEQTQRTARNVEEKLGLGDADWKMGYQCRFDRSRQWLSPFTGTVLDDLADARRLFVVAPNFSVDCLETLYDIQHELREKWLATRSGSGASSASQDRAADESFRYIPCLNDSDAHVQVIRGVAMSALA